MISSEERTTRATAAGLQKWQVCFACGLADAKIEGGGVWYCPNPRCSGCAGGQRRHVEICEQCVTVKHPGIYDRVGDITLVDACDVFVRKL